MSAAAPAEAPDLRGFGDLDWQGWLVLISVATSFVVMILDLCSPALTMLAELVLFMAFGVISVSEALAGFSSTGVWTVAVMFVVAQGIAGTGGLDYLMGKVLGCPNDVTLGQFRVMLITLAMSSFVSDTPVTAIMIPVTIAFCQKARLPPKQILILVGFAALTGGTNTVIGTSTNLVIKSQMDARYGDPESPFYRADYTGIGTFDITKYGLPGSVWLMVICTLLSPILLTHGEGFMKWINYFRPDAVGSPWKQSRAFDVALKVGERSAAVGMSFDETGLMDLKYIIPISIRRGTHDEPVTREAMIDEGDIITFAGDLTKLPEVVLGFHMHPVDEEVTYLTKIVSADELSSHDGDEFYMTGKAEGKPAIDPLVNPGPPRLFSAVVPAGSPLIRNTSTSVDFLTSYGASLMAVCRGKEPVEGPVGDVKFEEGDKLLLDVGPSFWPGDTRYVGTFSNIAATHMARCMQEYMLPVQVKGILAKPLLAGSSVSQAGLKAVVGAHLVGLERTGLPLMSAVADEEVLQLGDILWFAGSARSLTQLRKTPGLEVYSEDIKYLKKDPLLDRSLVEATIAPKSPLLGKAPSQVQFADKFQAAVVAVRRQGFRVVGAPNAIPLKPGDTLLLEAGDTFTHKTAVDSACFTVVKELPNTTPPKLLFVFVGLAIFIPCFLSYAVWNWRPITAVMGIAASLMLLTRCLSPKQAWAAIDWKILMCIGAALGISAAMEKTGGAEAIANALIAFGEKLGGQNAMLVIIFVCTTILSQIVMNTPAASIIFPVAATIADSYGLDIYVMAYAVMIAASAVYTTPFGDNINLMTYGAGDYSTFEFVRYGIFVQILMCTTSCVTLVSGQTGKWTMWIIITAIVAAVVLGLPHVFALVSYIRDRKVRQRHEQLKQNKMQKMTTWASMKQGPVAGGDVQYEAIPRV